jgi:hypothetical protein
MVRSLQHHPRNVPRVRGPVRAVGPGCEGRLHHGANNEERRGCARARRGVPARFVSALDNKGHEMVEDYGYKKAYQYQLVDGKGHPFKASDLKNQEQKLSQSNPNAKVITSGPMRLSSQGILTDMVGLPRPPGLNDRPSHTVETFSNTVYWNGYPYPVSTVFRHDISVNHGVVTINATIDVP